MDASACIHKEANTRIVYNLYEMSQKKTQDDYNEQEGERLEERKTNAVVRTEDIDVFILLTHFAPKMGNMQLYMDAGKSFKNNRRLIYISFTIGSYEHCGIAFCTQAIYSNKPRSILGKTGALSRVGQTIRAP